MKSNLKPRLKKAAGYIVFIAVFYILSPLAAAYIEISTDAQAGLLFLRLPMIDCCVAIAAGYFYGKRAARDPLLPVVCAIAFLIGMVLYFGGTAWIYIPLTALCCYVGQCFGAVSRGRAKK